MSFWSTNTVKPLRKRSFIVSIGVDCEFVAKSVNKPTIETDINEYRLINQIVKFPSVPRWNDITIKYVDTKDKSVSYELYTQFVNSLDGHFPDGWEETDGCPQAIKKMGEDVYIMQLDNDGKEDTKWILKGATIKSINFGDLDYSSDDFVEVEVVFSYDWAYID